MTDAELDAIEAGERCTALCPCEECAETARRNVLALVAEVRRLKALDTAPETLDRIGHRAR